MADKRFSLSEFCITFDDAVFPDEDPNIPEVTDAYKGAIDLFMVREYAREQFTNAKVADEPCGSFLMMFRHGELILEAIAPNPKYFSAPQEMLPVTATIPMLLGPLVKADEFVWIHTAEIPITNQLDSESTTALFVNIITHGQGVAYVYSEVHDFVINDANEIAFYNVRTMKEIPMPRADDVTADEFVREWIKELEFNHPFRLGPGLMQIKIEEDPTRLATSRYGMAAMLTSHGYKIKFNE